MDMLDRLLEKGATGVDSIKGLRAEAESLQIFRIDNVAEYLYAGTDQEVWDVKKDFPCLAPPYESFWMEFGRPSKVVSRVNGVRPGDECLPYRIGLWFKASRGDGIRKSLEGLVDFAQSGSLSEQIQKAWTPEIDAELRAFKAGGGDITVPGADKDLTIPTRKMVTLLMQYAVTREIAKPGGIDRAMNTMQEQKTYWVMECHSFVQEHRHGPVFGPLVRHVLQIDESGNVLHVSTLHFSDVIERATGNPEALDGLNTLWFAGLLAISFCHCKNVTIRAEDKPAALKKKQQRRLEGRRALTFHILEIAPIQKVLRGAESQGAGPGLQRALHFCRGHFANYEEKGLFGKYKGRFWVPQHLRGTSDVGVVVKDYAVKEA